jgi:uracil-DNA glycosylase
LKHRPPGNRNPNPDERLRSLPYLLKQIDLIQPKVILCLGKISGTTLLKKEESLGKLRGVFYPFRGAELTVTYHPAALLRNPQWKRPTWEDVKKVRKRYNELGGKP